jgi:acyl carrier protein
MAEIAGKLREVFVEALDLEADVDVENLKYRDIEAWDSVGHMALIAALEDEFDVQFDTDQVIDMSSFQGAADMIKELQGNRV